MPRLASVAGIVRVDGVPREGIRLRLVTGSDEWLDHWIAHGLETVGLHERPFQHIQSTRADGSFRYEPQAPDWSGALRVADSDDYRFANGAQRIELARPDETLVLELEALHPELQFRGRVVFGGQPVPEALWERSDSAWGRCDGLGNFSIHVFEDELEGLRLEFSQSGLGAREVELGGHEIRTDLGDVELLPTRDDLRHSAALRCTAPGWCAPSRSTSPSRARA